MFADVLSFIPVFYYFRSRVSSGSIVSDYGLDDGAIVIRSQAGAKDFSSSLCPDRLWGPPSVLYNGYRWSFPRGVKRGRGVTLTTHPHLLPRSRMSRSYIYSPPQAPPRRVAGLLYLYFLYSTDYFCKTLSAISNHRDQ
jgi:hypothetical protein